MSDQNLANGPAGPNPALHGPGAEPRMFKAQDVVDMVDSRLRFLEGKVLTIVDAAFSDREQRKAVKDLTRQQFREQQKWIYEIVTGHRMLCASGEEMKPC